MRSAELIDKRKKHDQVKHLGLCISAWTRRLKPDELDQSEQEQRRIAELLHQRKYHKVCGLRVLSSDINGKRKHHDQVKHLGPFFLTGRNASSHMNYINMSNSNCAAHKYLTQRKKHDPVNHLGLGNSDWTKRLKSHDVANFQTS